MSTQFTHVTEAPSNHHIHTPINQRTPQFQHADTAFFSTVEQLGHKNKNSNKNDKNNHKKHPHPIGDANNHKKTPPPLGNANNHKKTPPPLVDKIIPNEDDRRITSFFRAFMFMIPLKSFNERLVRTLGWHHLARAIPMMISFF
jgi:hypothetical protein